MRYDISRHGTEAMRPAIKAGEREVYYRDTRDSLLRKGLTGAEAGHVARCITNVWRAAKYAGKDFTPAAEAATLARLIEEVKSGFYRPC